MSAQANLRAAMVAYEQLARALDAVIGDAPGLALPGINHDRETARAGAEACRRVLAGMASCSALPF